jgi:hypothetical protein
MSVHFWAVVSNNVKHLCQYRETMYFTFVFIYLLTFSRMGTIFYLCPPEAIHVHKE